MKTVIIVSKCTRIIKFNQQESWHEFHFRGVCAGEALHRLLLRGRKDLGIMPGEEYLLYVQLLSIDKGLMRGGIIKLKRLSECWDRS